MQEKNPPPEIYRIFCLLLLLPQATSASPGTGHAGSGGSWPGLGGRAGEMAAVPGLNRGANTQVETFPCKPTQPELLLLHFNLLQTKGGMPGFGFIFFALYTYIFIYFYFFLHNYKAFLCQCYTIYFDDNFIVLQSYVFTGIKESCG